MTYAYLLIFGTIALLSVSVVAVFVWAIRTGQFSDFQRGATSIFDDDEPLGEITDWFPDQGPAPPPGALRADAAPLPMTANQDHADRN